MEPTRHLLCLRTRTSDPHDGRRDRLRRLVCACCGRRTWISVGPPRCIPCTDPPTGHRDPRSEPVGSALDLQHASARFPLTTPPELRGSTETPSGADDRPWGLRRAQPTGKNPMPRPWRYDRTRQIAVDPSGTPLTLAAPTAKSITSGDGDEGPSEDWSYDFCPDETVAV